MLQQYLPASMVNRLNGKPTARITVAFLFGLIGSILILSGSLQTMSPWYECTDIDGETSSFNLRTVQWNPNNAPSVSLGTCDSEVVQMDNGKDDICSNTNLALYFMVPSGVVAMLSSLIMMGLYCCQNNNCNGIMNMILMILSSLTSGWIACRTLYWVGNAYGIGRGCEIGYIPFGAVITGSLCCLISACCSCVCCCSAKPKLEQDLAYAQISMIPQPAYHHPSQVTSVPASYLPNDQYVPPAMSINGTNPNQRVADF